MKRRIGAWSRYVSALGVVSLGALGAQERAHAAGVEDTVTGTVALGRTAGFVRANDYQAVWQNPANLALLGAKDAGLELRLPVFHGCFNRTPDPNMQYLATESFDKSCNEGSNMLTGSVGFSMPLPKGFGFGVGIFTPGGTPKLKFGDTRINSINIDPMMETVPITSGARESPGRYMLIDKSVTAVFLMAGAGYSPIPQLRFGVSVGGGVIDVKFKNVSSLLSGTFQDQEVLSDVDVVDAYVPRATLSVGATPLDSIDLMATFTYNGDVNAKGDLTVTGNGLGGPVGDCASQTPGTHCKVDDVELRIPYQRFEVVLGGRYAMRRNKRERVLDPMKDELFDVELNAYWSQTSHVDNYTLRIHDNDPTQRIAFSSAPNASTSPLPTRAALYHGWKDTYGVRVGGDYNVLPERLALRAGFGFETRGAPKRSMNLDYWPVQKFNISIGATVQLGRWKVSAAYARVFNQTVDVKVGEGNVREVVALRPNDPATGMPRVAGAVNEGKFTSSIDVFSLQGNVSF